MLFMTPRVLKNAVAKPATRQYPFVVREPFAKYRGELIIKVEDCIFCSSCARKCPSLCIEVDKKAGTWTCDPYACIYCGLCVEACPTDCLSMKTVHRTAATGKEMIVAQGTPPKPKKKKKEEAAE